MKASRAMYLIAAPWLMVSSPATAWAQQPPGDAAAAQALRQEMEQLKSEFDARMTALEQKLAALSAGLPTAATAAAAPSPELDAAQPAAAPAEPGAAQASAAPAPLTAQVPAGAGDAGGAAGDLPIYGAAAASSKVFNPDIAVIGDFLGAMGSNSINPQPALQMHESEASFQAVVDPYARADFFLAFGEEGVDLEEGFVTFPTVPGGLLMKVGKMRSSFGKVNTLHNHVLPWTDRPLVIENLVGGEEGLSDAGISLARLVPNPWFFLEATGQVFRGDSGDVFHSSERSDLSYVARLRGYHDLTESTNLDVGGSYAFGHNPSGLAADLSGFTTELWGADATLRWKPLQRSIYHSFVARFEGVVSRREQPDRRQDSSGFYASGDYQLTRRWYAGARYDASDRAYDDTLRDTGGSLLITYWPSEFSQIRGQYRRTKYAEGETANEFLFQFQFSIGAHGAHPF